MKTILIIAYHYPPENSSCSEKNVRIAKIFAQSGYEVRVLTGNYIPEIISEDGITVYHTNSGKFHHNISTCSDGSISVLSNQNSRIKTKVKQFLSGAAIPDATIDWNYEAKKYISEHPEILDGVDLIYSISSPYSAHLLSRYLSRKSGIPYVMSYGDPWLYEPKRKRGPIRYAIEKKMEGDLIREASGVSLITDWNRREYIRLYGIPEDKINTYLIGYEKSENSVQHNSKTRAGFSLLYGGSLDPIHRNVEPFMKAMKNVKGVYVEIRNNDFPTVSDMVKIYGLEKTVEVKPLIPSSEFDALQYSFDALILFGNKTPFQIPGKVFTYISTGKTIVYIKNNDCADDGTEEVLRNYGNVIIVKNEENAIANGIMDFISKGTIMQSNAEQFTYQTTMLPLVEMVDRVIAQNEK